MKRYRALSLAMAALFVAGFAGTAVHAQQIQQVNTVPPAIMQLQIDQSGNTILRGTVKSVATNTLTVTSWGGDWTVNVASTTTQVIPVGPNGAGDLSAIKIGDQVSAMGMIQSQSLSINATVVRDWSTSQQQTARQLFIGTASNVSGSSFTLTGNNNIAYTVMTDSNTTVWNTRRSSLNFSRIQSGDRVRVLGVLSGNVIVPSIVRDISR